MQEYSKMNRKEQRYTEVTENLIKGQLNLFQLYKDIADAITYAENECKLKNITEAEYLSEVENLAELLKELITCTDFLNKSLEIVNQIHSRHSMKLEGIKEVKEV